MGGLFQRCVRLFAELLQSGVDGFSPFMPKNIEAIDDAVPVGVVAYGPESIDAMYRLFAD